MDTTEYWGLVGSLQYLTFTKIDITYIVNCVCQHFQSPTNFNLRAIRRIPHYLKGTQDFGIRFLAQSPQTFMAS